METAGVDLAAVAAWMDGQGLGSGPLEDAVLLAGGTQNILLKFSRAGRSYVLRRPPPHLRANSNETMRREARVGDEEAVVDAVAPGEAPEGTEGGGEPTEASAPDGAAGPLPLEGWLDGTGRVAWPDTRQRHGGLDRPLWRLAAACELVHALMHGERAGDGCFVRAGGDPTAVVLTRGIGFSLAHDEQGEGADHRRLPSAVGAEYHMPAGFVVREV